MLSKNRLKTGKRAWLRILEAFIAIMILIGFFAYINARQNEAPDTESEIHDILRRLFDEMKNDEMIRLAILEGNGCVVDHFVVQRIPSYLAFQSAICSMGDSCGFPAGKTKPRTDIYADYTIISSSIYQKYSEQLQTINPRVLKLFVWEGKPELSQECKTAMPNAPACGNGAIEGAEQCDGSQLLFTDCKDWDPAYLSGTLKCTSSCFFDASRCSVEEVVVPPVPGKCTWLDTYYEIGKIIKFGSSIGECDEGEKTCTKLSETTADWKITKNEITPKAETCDGKDNDCDASSDEWADISGLAPLCAKQQGVCAGSKQSCASGAWQVCTDTTYKAYNSGYVAVEKSGLSPDVCADNKDNDCDGTYDFAEPECG